MHELPPFQVGPYYGYNQELFTDRWMKIGGCGAVTACDVSIHLALYKNKPRLYPYDIHHLTVHDYVDFSQLMKPYLRPRYGGIDTLELWMDGYKAYLAHCCETALTMEGLYSTCSLNTLKEAIIGELDEGYPVPYLNLKHGNPNFANYVWHWFWLAGYMEYDGQLMVKLVSYGTFRWVSLEELWHTGYSRKGGIILFDQDKKVS